MNTFGFNSSDLALIRMMPRATVGGGITMPSGLQMKKGESRVLTDDFEENVRICWSLIQKSEEDNKFWDIVSESGNLDRPHEQTAPNAPYFANTPSDPQTKQSFTKRLAKFLRGE